MSHSTINIGPDQEARGPAGSEREGRGRVKKPLGARERRSMTRGSEPFPLYAKDNPIPAQGNRVHLREPERSMPRALNSTKTNIALPQTPTHIPKPDPLVGALDHQQGNSSEGCDIWERVYLSFWENEDRKSQYQYPSVEMYAEILADDNEEIGSRDDSGIHEMDQECPLSKPASQSTNAPREIPLDVVVLPENANFTDANPLYPGLSIGPPAGYGGQLSGSDHGEGNESGNTSSSEPVEWSEDDAESSDESGDDTVGNVVPESVWEAAPAWDTTLVRETNCQNVIGKFHVTTE